MLRIVRSFTRSGFHRHNGNQQRKLYGYTQAFKLMFSTSSDGNDNSEENRENNPYARRRELAQRARATKAIGDDADYSGMSDSDSDGAEMNVSSKKRLLQEELMHSWRIKYGRAEDEKLTHHDPYSQGYLHPSAYEVREAEWKAQNLPRYEQFGHDLRRIMLTRKWREAMHISGDERLMNRTKDAERADTYEAYKKVLDKDEAFDPQELKDYFENFPKASSEEERILKRARVRRNIKRAAGYIKDNLQMFQEMKLRQFIKEDEYRDALIEAGLQLSPNNSTGNEDSVEDVDNQIELEHAETKELDNYTDSDDDSNNKENKSASEYKNSRSIRNAGNSGSRTNLSQTSASHSNIDTGDKINVADSTDISDKENTHFSFLGKVASAMKKLKVPNLTVDLNSDGSNKEEVEREFRQVLAHPAFPPKMKKYIMEDSMDTSSMSMTELKKWEIFKTKVYKTIIPDPLFASKKDAFQEEKDKEARRKNSILPKSVLDENEEFYDSFDDDEVLDGPEKEASDIIRRHVFATHVSLTDPWSKYVDPEKVNKKLDSLLNKYEIAQLLPIFEKAIEEKIQKSLIPVDPTGTFVDGADWAARLQKKAQRKSKYIDDSGSDIESSSDSNEPSFDSDGNMIDSDIEEEPETEDDEGEDKYGIKEEGWHNPVFGEKGDIFKTMFEDQSLTYSDIERRFAENEFRIRVDAEKEMLKEDTYTTHEKMREHPDWYLVKDLKYQDQRTSLGYRKYTPYDENKDKDTRLLAPEMMEATWEQEFEELKQRFYFYNSDWLPTHDGLLDGQSTNLYKTYSWSPNFLYRDEWDEFADYRGTGGTKGYTKKGDVDEHNVDEHLDMKQREFYWDAIAAEIGRQIENQAEPPCALQEWKLRRRADVLLRERFRVKPKTKLHEDGFTSNGKGTRKTASARCTIQRVRNDVPVERIPKPIEKKVLAVELIMDESEELAFQLNINAEDHLVEIPKSIFDQTMEALRNLTVNVKKPVAIKLDDIDDDAMLGKKTTAVAEVKLPKQKKGKKQENDGASNEDLAADTPSLFDHIDMEAAYDAEFDSYKLEQYMSKPSIPAEWFDDSQSGRHMDWTEGKRRQGGLITVNGKSLGDYFAHPYDRHDVMQPLIELGVLGEFNIDIKVKGGGTTGQAQAAKLAVARAVQNQDIDLFRPLLRKYGHLSVDTRQVERKKPGLKKARKASQWVKR